MRKRTAPDIIDNGYCCGCRSDYPRRLYRVAEHVYRCDTCRDRVQADHFEIPANAQRVPCGLCDAPTPNTETRRCDRCRELETLIRAKPELARMVLATIPLEYPAPPKPKPSVTGK